VNLIQCKNLDSLKQLLSGIPKALDYLNGKCNKGTAKAFLGLARNSKMPCLSFDIPAKSTCNRGGKLAEKEGTVCSGCYADKGMNVFKPARIAKQRRLEVLKECMETVEGRKYWREAFVHAMKGENYFRWHSAGDMFSPQQVILILDCVRFTPWVQHWVPTREFSFAKAMGYSELDNLVVRVSDDFIDQINGKNFPNTSGVHKVSEGRGEPCSATKQEGCGPCRKCWQQDVKHISYPYH
jgi:hypothetical protein